MKSNIELARLASTGDGTELSGDAIDAFSAIVEQRQIERLMGEKVEPVATVRRLVGNGVTPDECKAYADARVREALEEAAELCEFWNLSIGKNLAVHIRRLMP